MYSSQGAVLKSSLSGAVQTQAHPSPAAYWLCVFGQVT